MPSILRPCSNCRRDIVSSEEYRCDLCDALVCRECITSYHGGGGGDVEWDGPDACSDQEKCEARAARKEA